MEEVEEVEEKLPSRYMMTQGAAQQSGRQMGMTAAPCLSPPPPSLSPLSRLSRLAGPCRLRLPPSPTGWVAWTLLVNSAPGG